MATEQSPLATGFFFEKPREGAPEFVKGKLSVKVEDAIALLNRYKNEKGYVNLDLLQSKDKTKLYMTVNTWKPETSNEPTPVKTEQVAPEITDQDVPF